MSGVVLLDIREMPGFDAVSAPPNDRESVTAGEVFFGRNPRQGGLETVCCRRHGAMNRVATLRDGGSLWRCISAAEYEPRCSVGAYMPDSDFVHARAVSGQEEPKGKP